MTDMVFIRGSNQLCIKKYKKGEAIDKYYNVLN